MNVAFEPNNDARSEKAYTKNLPLLKIQTHETVNPEDWQGLLADAPPGMEKALWCIGCAGMFMVNTEDKFDVWCAYCITVAQSVAAACGEDTAEDRVYLMGYGLAARTFNFAAHPVRRGECDPAPFVKAAQYECKDDVDFFSMWHLLVVLIELLRLSEAEDMHDMVSAMVKMNQVRARYRQAADKLPKRDAQ